MVDDELISYPKGARKLINPAVMEHMINSSTNV